MIMKAMKGGVRLFIARAISIALLIAPAALLPVFAQDSGLSISEAVDAACGRDRQKISLAREALLKAGAQAVPELIAGMRPDRCREKLLRVVEKIGTPAFVPLLSQLKNPTLRQYAGSALARIASPDCGDQVPQLLACLRDGNVRHSCGTALIKVMGSKASAHLPEIIRALKDGESQVRVYAAGALGQLGSRESAVVHPLAESLKDPEAQVRAAAASALGRMGRKARPAVAGLEAARQDPDISVRRAIVEALNNING